MTKKPTRVIFVLLMLSVFSGHAVAGCELPSTTPIIPDGNVASMDELVAAQKGMKEYQALLDKFRTCLDEKQTGLNPDAEDAAAMITEIATKHDSSVDAEQKIVEEFNAAVRVYKARQPAATE